MLALGSAFGFAAKAIFVKLVYTSAPVDFLTLLALRMLFTVPCFALLWLWKRPQAPRWTPQRADVFSILLLGFLGQYLSSLLDLWGLHFITAALERIVLFTYPTWVLLLSAAFTQRRIVRREWVAVMVTMLGIVASFWGEFHITSTDALWKGCLLVLGCSVTYALYLLLGGELIGRLGSVRFGWYGLLASSAFTLTHFLATHPIQDLVQPSHVYWLTLALALFGTAMPIWLLAEAIARIGAQRVALISSAGPIMTIWLGILFLGEPLTWQQVVGALLVIGGVTLATRMKVSTEGTRRAAA